MKRSQPRARRQPIAPVKVESDYREKIIVAPREVESALVAENPATDAGNLGQLHAVITTLDAVTKLLADLLMNRAMEQCCASAA